MNVLLSAWYVDASPGAATTTAKCGEKLPAIGLSGVSLLTHLITGAFTMADTLVLSSFPYLVGKTVSVFLGGLDCGDLVVASDGSLSVPYGNDAGGLLTPQYLVSISSQGAYGDLETHIKITDSSATVTDVYVPCVVGYSYTSQAQVLRTVTQDEMKTPKGPGTGKLARTFKFSAFVWSAVAAKFGLDFSHLMSQKFTYGNRTTQLPATTAFTGVHEATIDDTHSFDSMICWQVDRPVPFGVISVTQFTNTEDR